MENMPQEQWSTVIRPRSGWFDIDLKELWQYRDLVTMFVKRSFTTLYKQTVLGPAWILINPLITTVIFTVVFGGIAGLAEEGVPSFLFYMAGNAVWSFFSSCITGTANTFVSNAGLFGKVYFPRLTMPISQVLIALVNLGIQMLMFFIFWVWFYFFGQEYGTVSMNIWVLALPAVLLLVMVLGLGVGIIVSSLTTKYRDLAIVVGFGVQLWMYATPVVYSMSEIAANSPRLLTLMRLNPMTEPVLVFRYALLGCGEISPLWLLYSAVFSLVMLAVGVVLFSRVEKTFMDTV
ncbi:MAG TPA: ABC transporter permease [Candidatus Fournierella pullicola]|uniref:Transport permease protein n=1 Tax=Candidatus Allofournierella pullicola TaxID=2838596 RepID=A0A9D1V6F6_9FIRM|nr:ABC transporter permease [Candidatus Fournierella pullicola]